MAAAAATGGGERPVQLVLASRREQHARSSLRRAGAEEHQARGRRSAAPRAAVRNDALAWPRSYTAQVLAKSCKPIPVMITSTVLYSVRYSAREYAAATLIAGAKQRAPGSADMGARS